MGRFGASLIARARNYQLCPGVPSADGAGADRRPEQVASGVFRAVRQPSAP